LAASKATSAAKCYTEPSPKADCFNLQQHEQSATQQRDGSTKYQTRLGSAQNKPSVKSQQQGAGDAGHRIGCCKRQVFAQTHHEQKNTAKAQPTRKQALSMFL
jgi:hypothetical protein